jgi:threonyl-tRNA synthetase
MFIIRDDEKQEMAIKPMSCPGHIIVYKSGAVKSYRDLPLRYSEFGICHRKESTGSLQGIMRLLSFTQDDGHIFCTPDQIVEETQNFCQSLKEAYSVFGFNDISVKLSTRPKVRVGTDEVWDLAEKSLSEAAMASNIEFSICEGEGAFYGPKLEFVLKDAMKRDWQCGTLQVDFILPERFNATYIDKNGDKKCPVLIHRAIFGSLERFVGILIENYSGFFPFWISPVQISICSVSEVAEDYALKVFKILTESGYRCTLDVKNEKITYKIREHSSQKVPFIIILGKSELENSTVTVRKFNTCENESVNLNSISEYFHNIGYK